MSTNDNRKLDLHVFRILHLPSTFPKEQPLFLRITALSYPGGIHTICDLLIKARNTSIYDCEYIDINRTFTIPLNTIENASSLLVQLTTESCDGDVCYVASGKYSYNLQFIVALRSDVIRIVELEYNPDVYACVFGERYSNDLGPQFKSEAKRFRHVLRENGTVCFVEMQMSLDDDTSWAKSSPEMVREILPLCRLYRNMFDVAKCEERIPVFPEESGPSEFKPGVDLTALGYGLFLSTHFNYPDSKRSLLVKNNFPNMALSRRYLHNLILKTIDRVSVERTHHLYNYYFWYNRAQLIKEFDASAVDYKPFLECERNVLERMTSEFDCVTEQEENEKQLIEMAKQSALWQLYRDEVLTVFNRSIDGLDFRLLASALFVPIHVITAGDSLNSHGQRNGELYVYLPELGFLPKSPSTSLNPNNDVFPRLGCLGCNATVALPHVQQMSANLVGAGRCVHTKLNYLIQLYDKE